MLSSANDTIFVSPQITSHIERNVLFSGKSSNGTRFQILTQNLFQFFSKVEMTIENKGSLQLISSAYRRKKLFGSIDNSF
jgi:hypothetical protein